MTLRLTGPGRQFTRAVPGRVELPVDRDRHRDGHGSPQPGARPAAASAGGLCTETASIRVEGVGQYACDRRARRRATSADGRGGRGGGGGAGGAPARHPVGPKSG